MSQDFTEIAVEKKRYVVLVTIQEKPAEQCASCGCVFHFMPDPTRTFICPICNRKCCQHCTPDGDFTPTIFPGRPLCYDCDELSVDEQIKIAAFTAEMNK